MDIRKYTEADRAACLEVLDSLGGAGRERFAAYLDQAPAYFVAEHDGRIVGCGGVAVEAGTGRLEWGMVHRDWQKQGLGRFLLYYRMREITKQAAVEMVTLRAPREAAGFYLAQGFRETGGDAVQALLSKRVAVCS